MRSLILATAVWAGLSASAGAFEYGPPSQSTTISGPGGTTTMITPVGRDYIITQTVPLGQPSSPPPAVVVVPVPTPSVSAPLPPTITHAPGSNWFNR